MSELRRPGGRKDLVTRPQGKDERVKVRGKNGLASLRAGQGGSTLGPTELVSFQTESRQSVPPPGRSMPVTHCPSCDWKSFISIF